MANSWDSFAVNFTNSFNNAQRNSQAQEAEVQNPFMSSLMKEFELAKKQIQDANNKAAEYMSGGQQIVNGLAGISSDFTSEDLSTYASTLLAANGGDIEKAQNTLVEQLNSGVLVSRTDLANGTKEAAQSIINPPAIGEDESVDTADAEAQTQSMLEDESSDAADNTPDPATASAVGSKPNPGIRLGQNLPDLEVEEVTYGDKFTSYFGGMLGGDPDEYNQVLLQEAHTKFRDILESTGQLDTYNKIRTGELTYKPFSMQSNIMLDVSAPGKQQLPDIHSIASLNEVTAIEAGIEAGLYTVTDEQKDLIKTLKEKFTTTVGYGLPNLGELKSEGAIRAAYALYQNSLTDPAVTIPEPYGVGLTALMGSLDQDGGATTSGLLTQFTSIFKSSGDDGALSEEDTTRIQEYLNGPSISTVLDSITFTDEKTVTKLTQLSTVRDRLNTEKARYVSATKIDPEAADQLFAGAFEAVERKQNTVRANEYNADHPGGQSVTKVVQDSTGNWTRVTLNQSMDTTNNTPVFRDAITNEIVPAKTEEGKGIVPLPPKLLEDHARILNQRADDFDSYNTAKSGLTEFLGLQGEMFELVTNNQKVLTAPFVSSLAGVATQLKNEVTAASDLIGKLSDPNYQKQFAAGFDDPNAIIDIGGQQVNPKRWAERTIASLNQEINALVEQTRADPVEDQAAQLEILKAKQLLATFKMGVLEGQSGTALSNRDFERLSQVLTAKTYSGFVEKMRSYGAAVVSSMELRHKNLVGSPQIKAWAAEAGLPFFPEGSKPESLSQMYAAGTLPSAAETAYGLFTGAERGGTAPSVETPAPEQAEAPTSLQGMTNGEALDLYNSLEPGAEYIAPDGTKKVKGGN